MFYSVSLISHVGFQLKAIVIEYVLLYPIIID